MRRPRVVWGARTTATDTNWQYVSTRRLFLYLEEFDAAVLVKEMLSFQRSNSDCCALIAETAKFFGT